MTLLDFYSNRIFPVNIKELPSKIHSNHFSEEVTFFNIVNSTLNKDYIHSIFLEENNGKISFSIIFKEYYNLHDIYNKLKDKYIPSAFDNKLYSINCTAINNKLILSFNK